MISSTALLPFRGVKRRQPILNVLYDRHVGKKRERLNQVSNTAAARRDVDLCSASRKASLRQC